MPWQSDVPGKNIKVICVFKPMHYCDNRLAVWLSMFESIRTYCIIFGRSLQPNLVPWRITSRWSQLQLAWRQLLQWKMLWTSCLTIHWRILLRKHGSIWRPTTASSKLPHTGQWLFTRYEMDCIALGKFVGVRLETDGTQAPAGISRNADTTSRSLT